MIQILFIAVGGGVGSVLRYALGGWVQRLSGGLFPLGTLVVNVLGCLFIGFLAARLSGPVLIRQEYQRALTVGLLGGFTTFSTFGLETFQLINHRQFLHALANMLASVGVGLAAVWFGYRLAEWLYGVRV